MVRDLARSFAGADTDGNHRLSFDEFLNAVPAEMRTNKSTTQLQQMFANVDADGSGTVSIDEFFIWTLSFARTSHGSGLEEAFLKYDKHGLGSLDPFEFTMAAEEIGFGDVATELFEEFDPKNNGVVHHQDVVKHLKRGVSRNAMRMITELAFDMCRPIVTLDTSNWKLTGETKELLRAEVLAHLRGHDPPGRTDELFRAMAGGKGSVIEREGFAAAMARIGLPPGNKWLVDAVFKQIDVVDLGWFGKAELRKWVNGVEIRKAMARDLTFEDRKGGDLMSIRQQMWAIQWSPVTLRQQLQIILISSRLGPLDLYRAWNSRGRELFSKREMLVMMKSIVNDLALWDEHVRDVVEQTYNILAKATASAPVKSASHNHSPKKEEKEGISIEEFQKFMQRGWADTRDMLTGNGALRRKLPPPVPKPAPMYGDPRWPNRIWPARRGQTAYARRQLYRPTDIVDPMPKPVPPLLPVNRQTAKSLSGQHFVSTREGQAVAMEAFNIAAGTPKRVKCYQQPGGPPLRRKPASLGRYIPFGGPSRISIVHHNVHRSASSLTLLRAQSAAAFRRAQIDESLSGGVTRESSDGVTRPRTAGWRDASEEQ